MLYQIYSYLLAVWTTLVVPCVTIPHNWQYCFNDWDVWLYPEIRRAWDLMQGDEVPYQEEKEYLENINNSE